LAVAATEDAAENGGNTVVRLEEGEEEFSERNIYRSVS
jgi:hypothetical protein